MRVTDFREQMEFLKELKALLEKHQCSIVPITQEESGVWFRTGHTIDFDDNVGTINPSIIEAKREEILFKALGKGKLK